MTYERFEPYMPRFAWDRLSPNDRHTAITLVPKVVEPDKLVHALQGKKEVLEGLKNKFDGCESLAWLSLQTPWRYSTFKLAPQPLLSDLVDWDWDHLNYTASLFKAGPEEELFFDQRFITVAAMMGNASASPSYLRAQIDRVGATWPYPEDQGGLDFAELLDYELGDKWDVLAFPNETLAMLEAYFNEQGMAEIAQSYSLSAIEERRREYDA